MSIKSKLAVFLSKFAKKTITVLGRQGTHLPGKIAQKIDKNIGLDIEKPNRIIAVTGTNGKTTTSNMVSDIIADLGYSYISNRLGSNTYYGIIASLLDGNSLFGNNKSEYGVFEIDELWSSKIHTFLKPNTLTITNLFQDSFERNVNVYYIFDKIEKGIPNGVKLILNGDDAISAYIKPENDRVYFSVENIFNEEPRENSNIEDVIYTKDNKEKLIWDFKRYNHIGKYRSKDGSMTNPKSKYIVTGYNNDTNELIILEDGKELILPLINDVIENVYNQIAVYATLRENGFLYEEIRKSMSKIKIVNTRFNIEEVGNKKIISLVAKGYNPIANSRVFDAIGKSDEKKSIVYIFDNLESSHIDVRTPGWISSIDFKYINNNLNKFILRSRHANEIVIPAILQGIDEEKIVFIDKSEDISKYIDKNIEEEIYLLHDIERENYNQYKEIRREVIKYLEGEK